MDSYFPEMGYFHRFVEWRVYHLKPIEMFAFLKQETS